MFKQHADEQLDGVPHAQDIEELEQAVVEERKLLGNPGHAERDGVAETPKPNRLPRTWERNVVKQVVDETLEYLKRKKQMGKVKKSFCRWCWGRPVANKLSIY